MPSGDSLKCPLCGVTQWNNHMDDPEGGRLSWHLIIHHSPENVAIKLEELAKKLNDLLSKG